MPEYFLSKARKVYARGLSYTLVYVYWRLKFSVLRLFGVRNTSSRYGLKLCSNFRDSTFKFYFFGSYGFFYSDFLSSYSSKFSFIDIGANQGLYTIIAAKNPNCEEVVSFEPILRTYELLTQNCSLNDVSDKCGVHNLAIGDACEVKKISYDEAHSGAASLASINQENESNFISIRTIDKTVLGGFFSKKRHNYVVKVDVEGYEYTVLAEIFKCDFSDAITNIYYEIDERWVNPSQIEEFLKKHGFNEFKRIGEGEHYDVMASRLAMCDSSSMRR